MATVAKIRNVPFRPWPGPARPWLGIPSTRRIGGTSRKVLSPDPPARPHGVRREAQSSVGLDDPIRPRDVNRALTFDMHQCFRVVHATVGIRPVTRAGRAHSPTVTWTIEARIVAVDG